MNIFKTPDIRDKARAACGQKSQFEKQKKVFRESKKPWRINRIPKK